MGRSTSIRLLVLGLAVTLPAATATARGRGAPTEMDPKAAEHLRRGVALHEQGQYADAADAFAAGHAIDPQPVFLFAGAQAERLAGDCAAAIDLYQRYAQTGPSPRRAAAAQTQIEECEQSLEAARVAAESDAEPEPEPDPTPVPAAQSDPSPRPKPRIDPVGLSLVTIGSVAVVAGVALLGSSGAQRSVALDAATYDDYEEAAQRRRTQAIAGGVVAGIGVPLVVAGAVVWATRNRKSRGPAPSAWLGRDGAGIAVVGRF